MKYAVLSLHLYLSLDQGPLVHIGNSVLYSLWYWLTHLFGFYGFIKLILTNNADYVKYEESKLIFIFIQINIDNVRLHLVFQL